MNIYFFVYVKLSTKSLNMLQHERNYIFKNCLKIVAFSKNYCQIFNTSPNKSWA